MRLCFFLLLTSSLFGDFSGYNLGLSLGGKCRIAHQKQREEASILFPDASSDLRSFLNTENRSLSDLTPVGEISLGWGRTCRCFYLGVIGALNFSGGTIEQKNSSTFAVVSAEESILETKLKLSFNIVEPTLDGKFGYLLCNNLLYLTIGGAYNSLYVNEDHRFYFENDDPVARLPTQHAKKKQSSLYGFRIGTGFEHLFCNSCSLFMNYTYTYFPEKTTRSTKEIIPPPSFPNLSGSHLFSTQLQPRHHLFSFGLRYYL